MLPSIVEDEASAPSIPAAAAAAAAEAEPIAALPSIVEDEAPAPSIPAAAAAAEEAEPIAALPSIVEDEAPAPSIPAADFDPWPQEEKEEVVMESATRGEAAEPADFANDDQPFNYDALALSAAMHQ